MSGFTLVAPNDLCDRCGHPMKYHAGSERRSECMVVNGKVWRGVIPHGMRAKQCWCDGFIARADGQP